MRFGRKYAFIIFALMCFLPIVAAEFSLAPIFTENMVLQQEMNVPIWGVATPGEIISIEFQDQKKRTTTDKEGNWKIVFDPLTSGGPYTMTIDGASASIMYTNIFVGEVWIAAGQSNMDWHYGGTRRTEYKDNASISFIALIESDRISIDKVNYWFHLNENIDNRYSQVGVHFANQLHNS